MKNKLWTFGDSHTAGHGCTKGFEYYNEYKKEGDEIWPVLLANELELSLTNLGENGSSNDMIFDKVIQYYKFFNEGDIVIIGQTYTHRFDIPIIKDNEKKLCAVYWDWSNKALEDTLNQYSNEQKETITNFQYYFMNDNLYEIRWIRRFNWIKIILDKIGCKCIVWDVKNELTGIETIKDASSGKIDDGHISFNGHKQFMEKIYQKNWGAKKIL